MTDQLARRRQATEFGYFQKSFVSGARSTEDPAHAEHEIRASAERAIQSIKKLEATGGKPSPLGPPLGLMAGLEDSVDSLAYWLGVSYHAMNGEMKREAASDTIDRDVSSRVVARFKKATGI